MTSVGRDVRTLRPSHCDVSLPRGTSKDGTFKSFLAERQGASPSFTNHAAFRMHHTATHSCCYFFFVSPRLALAQHNKSSTKNNLQGSETCVNVMAPLPSVSLAKCLKKSVLLHMMLFVYPVLASTSSSTCCQILPIAFLVHAGRFSFPSPIHRLLLTFARPCK